MHIGILTSGGDAPGMNAAIRTVIVTALSRGHSVVGISRGYEGLLIGETVSFALPDVDGITRQGGTILGSARSAEFPTEAGQKKANQKIRELGLDALVVIGGNGSLAGAHLLGQNRPCAIIGLPASIDNDIGHNGLSIGVDTAANTIVEACDRISDTARAHRRAFIVEVMGRQSGYLAMRAGIAAEADALLFGESGYTEDEIVAKLRDLLRHCFSTERKKNRVLIVKAEGVKVPTSRLIERLGEHLVEDAPGVEIRATILGHVVRGGNPSTLDRMIGQRLGYGAVLALEKGAHDVMMGWDVHGDVGEATLDPAVRVIPLAEVLAETQRLFDGTSEVVKARTALLERVEELLAF